MEESATKTHGAPGESLSQPSLVDATVTLFERWPFFLVPFVLVNSLFVWLALHQDKQYEFVSVYQPASLSVGGALQSPDSLVLTLRNVIVPEVHENVEPKHNVRKQLATELDVDSPRHADLILISSEGGKDLEPEVRALHEMLIAHLGSYQGQLVADHRASVEKKLESVRAGIDILDPKEFSEAYSEALQMEASLEANLREIKGGQSLVLARAKEKAGGLTPFRLLILGGLVAFFGSVIFVFFIEFCSRVNARLSKKNSRSGA